MSLPVGTICLWYGAIVDIPAGFVLCNGANGTPDLRNKFIVGAGDTYAVADGGGDVSHSHSLTSDGHTHSLGGAPIIGSGANFDNVSSENTDNAITNSKPNFPPYYAIAYIMRV